MGLFVITLMHIRSYIYIYIRTYISMCIRIERVISMYTMKAEKLQALSSYPETAGRGGTNGYHPTNTYYIA